INSATGAESPCYDLMSARGNLWFFSQLYGLPSEEAHRRINELSAMLGLENYLDRKFYALSTGYRQRVTIVRAFVNDPRVVFLDEPTIGLDVMTAISIREFLLRQAKNRGRTIILATHNMSEVDAICDKVAIIDKGKILACDTPSALKRSLGAPALVMEVSPPPPPERLEMLARLEGVKGYTSTIDEERGISRVQVVVNSDDTDQTVLEASRKAGMNYYWANLCWSKQSQIQTDKHKGLVEIYISSPAPITAILVGMSLGGIIGTAPSAALVAFAG